MRKATILLAVIVACALPFMFANAAEEDRYFNYSVSILNESNIEITEAKAGSLFFGDAVPSVSYDINDSLNIVNTGNGVPGSAVFGNFTTQISGVYGLNNSAQDQINASNFWLNNTQFQADGGAVPVVNAVDVPAGSDFNISASIDIPDQQPSGYYQGEVWLHWESSSP